MWRPQYSNQGDVLFQGCSFSHRGSFSILMGRPRLLSVARWVLAVQSPQGNVLFQGGAVSRLSTIHLSSRHALCERQFNFLLYHETYY
ncbi:hypothetical protein LINGRAHAP2_LOCUS7603 [Linum grandiflorum]